MSICSQPIAPSSTSPVSGLRSGIVYETRSNKIDSEPSPFVGLRSVKLSLVNNQSQGGNYEHEGISDKLKPIYQSRTTRLIVGCLFLASAAILFLYAQIIPARCYLLGRNLAVGLVIGLLLLVLGFLCTAQFYDLVLK
jgi:hypothetical protein